MSLENFSRQEPLQAHATQNGQPWQGYVRPARGLTTSSAAPRYRGSLELQQVHFRGAGEVPTAPGIHDHHVLDPHRAPAGIVETRLHGHHLPRLELVVQPADARGLVNVEPDAMPGAVEKALLPTVHHPGRIAAGLHGPRDLGVDGSARRAVADQLDAAKLSGQDGVVEPPE